MWYLRGLTCTDALDVCEVLPDKHTASTESQLKCFVLSNMKSYGKYNQKTLKSLSISMAEADQMKNSKYAPKTTEKSKVNVINMGTWI